MRIPGAECSLISRVKEEDKGDDGVSRLVVLGNEVSGCADRLECEEDEHASRGYEEQLAATNTFDHERCENCPKQVPDSQDTVRRGQSSGHTRKNRYVPSDEQLDRRVRDADGVHDLGEVVGDEAVAGPLREPGDGDDDEHASPVAGRLKQRLPAHSSYSECSEPNCAKRRVVKY